MAERLSAEAELTGGGEPERDGLVMREDCLCCEWSILGPVALEKGEATGVRCDEGLTDGGAG